MQEKAGEEADRGVPKGTSQVSPRSPTPSCADFDAASIRRNPVIMTTTHSVEGRPIREYLGIVWARPSWGPTL